MFIDGCRIAKTKDSNSEFADVPREEQKGAISEWNLCLERERAALLICVDTLKHIRLKKKCFNVISIMNAAVAENRELVSNGQLLPGEKSVCFWNIAKLDGNCLTFFASINYSTAGENTPIRPCQEQKWSRVLAVKHTKMDRRDF